MISGGWLNRNYIQLAYQLADSVSGFTYSFFGTCIILFFMNLIPGLSLRASQDAEVFGIDDAELGEFAYDYVEHKREIPYAHSIQGVARSSGSDTPVHQVEPKSQM